jgi:CDP-diacylglycerol--glycerol-3-phosphate 3-phosphatidyltransferase
VPDEHDVAYVVGLGGLRGGAVALSGAICSHEHSCGGVANVRGHLARPADRPTLVGEDSGHKGSEDLAGALRPIASTLVLSQHARPAVAKVLDPIGRALLRLGLTPDSVTVIGTVGVSAAALILYPRGSLLAGTLVIAVFALADSIDGTMARLSGRSSRWGAFLDSVLDRVSDAAIFGGLTLWFVAEGSTWGVPLSLAALVLGQLVSYTRARAEGLGAEASVGLAERAERLILVLLAAAAVGLGLPAAVLVAAMGVLVVLSAITVGQRVVVVWRQLHEPSSEPAEG